MNRLAHCISVQSMDAVGAQMFAYGGSTPGSLAWPAANDAILVPITIRYPCIALRMYVVNGLTASGNLDVGIYTEDGALLVSKGSTAQSGTTAPQYLDITDKFLSPGNYYMACAMDGTTGTNRRHSMALERLVAAGVIKGASSFPLPATITFATVTATYLPQIGIDLIGTMT